MNRMIPYILLLGLLLSLAACGGDRQGGESGRDDQNPMGDTTKEAPAEEQSSEINEAVSMDSGVTIPVPPDLTVFCEGAAYRAQRTTYSWTREEKDGAAPHAEADGPGPFDYDWEEHLEAIPYQEGGRLLLSFDQEPDRLEVSCWRLEEIKTKGKVAGPFWQRNLYQRDMRELPAKAGTLYMVKAFWDVKGKAPNRSSYGNAFYFFMTALPVQEVRQSPPRLTVASEGEPYRISGANYNWNWPEADGNTGTAIACGPHPLQQKPEDYAWNSRIPVANNAVLKIGFEGDDQPDEISVRCWRAEYAGQANADAFEAQAQTIPLSPDGTFMIPWSGACIFSVKAVWNEAGKGSEAEASGNAEYTFLTEDPAQYREPVDIWENADLMDSLLMMMVLDGKEGRTMSVHQERYRILEQIKEAKAYPADDFTPEKMTYPLYGLWMGSKDHMGAHYLWTNGYMITQDGKAYRCNFDFSMLKGDAWEEYGVKPRSVAEMPCGFLLVKDSSGEWFADRLLEAVQVPPAEDLVMRIAGLKEGNVLELQMENTGKGQWTYGESYQIEVFLKGNWYGVPAMLPNGLGFYAIGYLLNPGQSASIHASLQPFFPLPAGRYRVIKTCHVQEGEKAPISYYMAAEFTVTPQGEIEY